MFGVSASVVVCNYFIPSALGVVLFSISTGFLMSLDLSQVGTLCRSPQAAFRDTESHKGDSTSPNRPSSFGWTLGCREVFVYLSLLVAALTEAGLLQHFLGSHDSPSLVTSPQAPVSYLVIILFCICWALREVQGPYIFGGMFLNPLYPKGISSVQAFIQKSTGLNTAAAIRRILLYFGKCCSPVT